MAFDMYTCTIFGRSEKPYYCCIALLSALVTDPSRHLLTVVLNFKLDERRLQFENLGVSSPPPLPPSSSPLVKRLARLRVNQPSIFVTYISLLLFFFHYYYNYCCCYCYCYCYCSTCSRTRGGFFLGILMRKRYFKPPPPPPTLSH